MRARTSLALLLLAAVSGCGDDDVNAPPQIGISSPGNGDHLTAAANVVAQATDDEGVARVRFTLDGTVLLDDFTAPWQAAIPVGEWANGQPVVLGATVWDTDGVSVNATSVTITIDPALQSVPQLLAFGPDAANLAARWLRFPGAAGYTLQFSHGAAFGNVFFTQSVTDTLLATAVPATGVVYARVRATVVGAPTPWSRSWRFASVPTLQTLVPLPASQAGLQVAMAPTDGFTVVSGPRDGVAIGAVAAELIQLDATGGISGRVGLPTAAAQWLTDDDLFICGDGAVARHGLDDGAAVWRVEPAGMMPSAIGAAADGASPLAAGRDTQEDATPSIAIVTLAAADGVETGRATLDLPAGDTVNQVWGFPAACMVAGQIATGGVWVRGVDLATQRELWHLRLGTGPQFEVRDAIPVDGDLILVGDSLTGGAWAASVAVDGRLRWLVQERTWIELGGVASAVDGGVLVTGHARGDGGRTDVVYGELTAGGAWRWKQRRSVGENARGLGVTQADDGSVVVVGTALAAGGWDLLLLRTDDRGDLD
jgi:hypothetical protein